MQFCLIHLQSISATQAKRFTKFRERKGLIDKDVVWISVFLSSLLAFLFVFLHYTILAYTVIIFLIKVRTDRSVPYYEGDDNQNVVVLRDILLTYSFYNFDLGYCQVSFHPTCDICKTIKAASFKYGTQCQHSFFFLLKLLHFWWVDGL
jgi:hypothetical protein